MTELETYVGVVREAPADLLRELRYLEPAAELLHMGGSQWLLGRIHPANAQGIQAAGARLMLSTNRATTARRSVLPTDRRRAKFARARLRNFLPIAEYHTTSPDGRIVRDLEVMTYLFNHTADADMLDMSEADKLKAQAEARADLTDPARGNAAWRYLFTRSHMVSRPKDDPGPAAGRIRHQVPKSCF